MKTGRKIVAIAAGEITRQRYIAAASSTPPRAVANAVIVAVTWIVPS